MERMERLSHSLNPTYILADPLVVKNNMDEEVTSNREERLKKAALTWACTLTPPTAFVTPNPGGSLLFFSSEIYVWLVLNIFFSSFR